MDRRSLLKQILYGARAIAVLPTLASAAIAGTAVASPRLLLQRSPLAGFQYHEGEKLWPQLSVGAALSLVREADNRHDQRAVRIDVHGFKLGYLPKIDNAAVSQLLDRGQSLAAYIVTLRQDRDPWKRVEVEIEWLPGGAAS
ncbi:HIRAN domain-containing protein [Panacagrimonas sp.]|uniref:HIRAN domain-containing protein n=1 Tax=Panacagrimonas sp. TaxID=2480088 RepID=UPI003B52D414